MSERRLSNKDTKLLIEAVRRGGWTVDEPQGKSNIYKARCPCGDHMEHIHTTPSGPHYAKNKLGHMRNTCWKEEV